MKRLLIDYKKLNPKLAAVLIEAYPYGYGDEDIITLQKPNGELIEAVEVKTADAIYLVKISKNFSNFISNFEENLEKELGKELPKNDAISDKHDTQQYLEFEPDTDF